jgi:shikimate dehydrogenase
MPTPRSFQSQLLACLGQPVAENPTGYMMEAAFARAGLNFRYLLMDVAPAQLADAVRGLRAMGFCGANCTVPHKVAVLPLLDRLSDAAARMGAVNTIYREGDQLVGENTDGKGFLRSLREDAGLEPAGKSVVVLGAGGAARAIGVELGLAGARRITIVNRGSARGQELVRLLSERTKTAAEFIQWQGAFAVAADADILVNATSIGLFPDPGQPPVDAATIRRDLLVCDVIPNPPDTPFLRSARSRGARTLDGLGMLCYQGAIAFKLWTGQDPDIAVMKKALQDVFAG